VSEWLFERFPEVTEGDLTQRRAVIVNAESLAALALELRLGAMFRMGVGEARSGGRERPSNLADALEALLGAVFLDGGFDAARRVVRGIFAGRVEGVATGSAKGPKSLLQEWAQAQHHVTPSYTLLETTGPAHATCFVAEVLIPGVLDGRGEGSSKKDAEKAAAQDALDKLAGD
jgi:ribonuclease-3